MRFNDADTIIRTLIVEDDEIVSVALKYILRQMPEVVLLGEVRDGKSAVSKAIELAADLVLMDIGLPGLDGIAATQLIKDAIPAKVIIVSSHQTREHVIPALLAGADAYCVKGISAGQLMNVIRSIMDGGMWLDPAISSLVRTPPEPDPKMSVTMFPDGVNKLSRRERQVLQLLATGLTNQEIAERLSVGTETVKTHIRHLMEKLGVEDRTQAAVKAVLCGWLET